MLWLPLAAWLAGCGEALESVRALGNEQPLLAPMATQHVAGGDPAAGRPLLARHACTTCHAIPGERAPTAHVGPPLTFFGLRTNIAGTLPNQPERLVRFIMHAPAEAPGTGMPDLAVDEAEARHIAALLYTFR